MNQQIVYRSGDYAVERRPEFDADGQTAFAVVNTAHSRNALVIIASKPAGVALRSAVREARRFSRVDESIYQIERAYDSLPGAAEDARTSMASHGLRFLSPAELASAQDFPNAPAGTEQRAKALGNRVVGQPMTLEGLEELTEEEKEANTVDGHCPICNEFDSECLCEEFDIAAAEKAGINAEVYYDTISNPQNPGWVCQTDEDGHPQYALDESDQEATDEDLVAEAHAFAGGKITVVRQV